MTIADLSKLSDEELNAELLKLQGWEQRWTKGVRVLAWAGPNGEWHPPFYPTDLNAVAAVEAGLTVEQRVSYVNNLLAVTKDADLSRITFATARQRAEALYATLTP